MKFTGVVLDSNFADEVKVNRFKTNMKRTFIFKKDKNLQNTRANKYDSHLTN